MELFLIVYGLVLTFHTFRVLTALTSMKLKLRMLERVFLTAGRMVLTVHASKLSPRKSRNIAPNSIRGRVVNKHGRLGQLKKCRVPLLFLMKVLFIEEEINNLYLRNSQKRAQVAQSWPKTGGKGYVKSEGGSWSRQPGITKSAMMAIDRSHFVLQNV